jgi:hypothetical protein
VSELRQQELLIEYDVENGAFPVCPSKLHLFHQFISLFYGSVVNANQKLERLCDCIDRDVQVCFLPLCAFSCDFLT